MSKKIDGPYVQHVYNGPLPSTLTLLSNLEVFRPGEKVRFLGCVVSYSAHLASLTLEHNHPPGNELKAIVDIRLVLDKLLHEHTRIGEWLNIIGYVERPQSRNLAGVVGRTVNVQAIAVWSAGPLRLQAYEECLDNSQMNVSGSETATKQGVM